MENEEKIKPEQDFSILEQLILLQSALQIYADTFLQVIDSICGKLTQNHPEPLTAEQLQAMDGKPIFAVPLGNIPARKPHWLIVDMSTPQFLLHYGETWIAYPFQPKDYQ